jgi:hypothetical protein
MEGCKAQAGEAFLEGNTPDTATEHVPSQAWNRGCSFGLPLAIKMSDHISSLL